MKKILASLLVALLAPTLAHSGPTAIGSSGGGVTFVPRLTFPDTMYVADGRQLNLWWQALMDPMPSLANAPYIVAADSGTVGDRGYQWTPTANSGNEYGYTIYSLENGVLTKAATTTVATISKTAGYVSTVDTMQCLFVGDSVLADEEIVEEVFTLFGSDGGGNLKMIGSQGDSTSLHEGRAGKKYAHLVTTDFPFWYTDHLDFQQYMADSSYAGIIDYAVVQLGYNDLVLDIGDRLASAADIDTLVSYADSFCTAMLDADTGYPKCKIIIGLQPLGCAMPSAWGQSYDNYAWGDSHFWWYFRENMNALNRALLRKFDGGAFDDNVTVCYTAPWIDPVYSYPNTGIARSSRDATSVTTWTNYLHPNDYGDEQAGDAYYSHLRALRRFDYNQITWSEDLSQWTATGSPVQATSVTGPTAGTTGQVWIAPANTLVYFELPAATTAAKVDTYNVMGAWFRRSNTNAYVRLSAICDSTEFYSQWVMTGPDTASVQANNPAAAADSLVIAKGTGSAYNDNWIYCRFFFNGNYTDADNIGQDLKFRVYLTRNTSSAACTTGVYGVQFEQGVTDPRTYIKTP